MPAHHAEPTRRILVIDDEPDCTFELVEHLLMNGLSCIGMTDPKAALELFRQDTTIKIVVSDIKMPGMDGITLAQEMWKSCGDTRTVAFVMVTGHAGLSEARQALDLDEVAFILKPIDLDDLDRAIVRGFQRLDIRQIERASLAILRTRRHEAVAGPGRVAGEAIENSAAFAALIQAIGTTMADMGGAGALGVPASPVAAETGSDQENAVELMALASQLTDQHASLINRRFLRLTLQPDDTIAAWGRDTIIEAALSRLITGFIQASSDGAELTLDVAVADGMASLSITSSAIAPVPDQDPGNSGGDLALDLGLAAIWTHEASGSLALAAVGREGLTVSISLPAAQDSGA